jgi:DNA N-6-adenine-methyltransferase (Dam)
MVALFDNVTPFPVKQKSNEWYTPARYIEAAREVMGGIDLDPASSTEANWTVKAKMYYKQEEDGLKQQWYGRVWLNPPYGSTDGVSNMGAFTRKLIAEYETGNVTQAIVLLTSKTDATWFQPLWNHPICFPDHLIYFEGDKPNKSHYNGKYCHIHGTTFTYLGPHEQEFIDVFSQFGTVAKRVSPARLRPTPVLTLWDMEEPPGKGTK